MSINPLLDAEEAEANNPSVRLIAIASHWTNHHLFFVASYQTCESRSHYDHCASSFLETGQLLRNHVTHCQTNNAKKYKTDMVMYDASNLLWAVICLDNVWIPQRSKRKSATNAKEHHKHRNETTQCNCCQRCLVFLCSAYFLFVAFLLWFDGTFYSALIKLPFFGGSGMRDSDVIEWKGTKPGTTNFVLTNKASSTICSGLFMMPMTSLRVWAKKLTIGVQSLINLMSWLLYI